MVRYLVCFMLLCLMASCSSKVALLDKELKTMEGSIIKNNDIEQESVFFLVMSLHCGYCIKDLSYYNSLSEKHGENLCFIALLEDDELYINKYKAEKLFLNEHWTVIPEASFYYENIWIKGLFPEYFIYTNRELEKPFAYSNKLTRNHIKLYLNLFY